MVNKYGRNMYNVKAWFNTRPEALSFIRRNRLTGVILRKSKTIAGIKYMVLERV